jgi:hypothetical protein
MFFALSVDLVRVPDTIGRAMVGYLMSFYFINSFCDILHFDLQISAYPASGIHHQVSFS